MNRYVISQNEGVFKEVDLEKGLYQNYVTHEVKTLSHDEIIRDICTKETIEDLLERIAFIRTIQAPSSQVCQELYDQAMAEYDEVEWMKLIKSVYMRMKMRKVFPFEKAYSDLAKSYVYSEISILMEIPFLEVDQYITDYIRENDWN